MQSVNSTHIAYPNALESLKILESAKDENGCVPMSLVRLAFRNVFEQDRWTPCKEKMPAKPFGCFVTVMDTNPITQEEFENILQYFVGWDGEQWNDADGEQIPCEVLAWRPLPKPYKLEE